MVKKYKLLAFNAAVGLAKGAKTVLNEGNEEDAFEIMNVAMDTWRRGDSIKEAIREC
jgi:hypothetical protein